MTLPLRLRSVIVSWYGLLIVALTLLFVLALGQSASLHASTGKVNAAGATTPQIAVNWSCRSDCAVHAPPPWEES
ncbi:MAG: hypothetical protein JST60_07435 [Chloroflexi bacterium SZAS-1]|nr:hypothetical protein [Chloroflexi bacterium SZAS-1]